MRMNHYACIASPCVADRVKGSAFCTEHKKAHAKSPWVKAWNAYQKECARVGIQKATFSPPVKKEVKES